METNKFKTKDSSAQIEVWEIKESINNKIINMNNNELVAYFQIKGNEAKEFFKKKGRN